MEKTGGGVERLIPGNTFSSFFKVSKIRFFSVGWANLGWGGRVEGQVSEVPSQVALTLPTSLVCGLQSLSYKGGGSR